LAGRERAFGLRENPRDKGNQDVAVTKRVSK